MNVKFLFPGSRKRIYFRIYFKECFAAFGGGNALLFWFSSHLAGVDERIERKERALTKVVGVHGSYPRLRFQ